MSGRRRRKSRDSDDDGSDGDDTEDDGDDESDDDEVEGTAEEPTSDETDPVFESLSANTPEDIPITNVEPSNPVKFEPKEILKNTNSEALQDTERRDKNNKRREARREADFSSQSQRKNPTFVPLSGNFFLHDDRESGRLVDDAREPSQLTEANLGRQALEQNQQKTRKERPNQRDRSDFQNKSDDQRDIWRHDKFEELLATERPLNPRGPVQGQGQGQGRDGPPNSYGGRGRSSRGDGGRGDGGRGDGGRGGGRGREGRGGRGPSTGAAPNVQSTPQNVPVASVAPVASKNVQNVPVASKNTQNVPVVAKNIPLSSGTYSRTGANTDKQGNNVNNNNNNNNSSASPDQNQINSEAEYHKYKPDVAGKQAAAAATSVSTTATTADTTAPAPAPVPMKAKERERGSIMTSGVFAAVQNRQRNAIDKTDASRQAQTQSQSQSQFLTQSHANSDNSTTTAAASTAGTGGVSNSAAGVRGGSTSESSSSQISNNHYVNYNQNHNNNNIQNQNQNASHQSPSQRSRVSQDIRKFTPKNQREQVKAEKSNVRHPGVITNIAAAIEDVTRIETDNKIALRAMKANAKEFRPSPSSSSPLPVFRAYDAAEDPVSGRQYPGEREDNQSKNVNTVSTTPFQSNNNNNNNSNYDINGNHQGQGQGQGVNRIPDSSLQSTAQHTQGGQGTVINHNYPTTAYTTSNAAPRYTHLQSAYEMPIQLMNAPLQSYVETAVYTENGAYPEAYLEGYNTQGGGQMMYSIEMDDRMLSQGQRRSNGGLNAGHRHQVLIADSMGIDPRTPGDMMTGQIGGTTYYDKGGVTYYQDSTMPYGDTVGQYGPSNLGETFDPYESSQYTDMHGQIIMGGDDSGVTMSYEDMSGAYYTGDDTTMRESNRTDNHISNGSTYYPQQSEALIPYVDYSTAQALPATPEVSKLKPLDLDGKAKPFSPSLILTSTATSTFSGMAGGKFNPASSKKEKEVPEVAGKESIKERESDIVEVGAVVEAGGVEEQKGNKDLEVAE